MFNSLLVKEEGTFKMVDDSACKVIGTKTINITGRDGTLCALKVVWYILEARYNLISIRVLDSEGYQVQVQHIIFMVNQGDRVVVE